VTQIHKNDDHIENAPKIYSMYYCYYVQRGKFSCTQISLHFTLLFATHLINNHFKFARVSITLIIYWDSPLM